jgi:osmoprotectant transport system substrate-binding protein
MEQLGCTASGRKLGSPHLAGRANLHRATISEAWMRAAGPLAIAALAALLLSIATSAAAEVVVGSKIDSEGALLGNMILLLLGEDGIATRDRTELGPTEIVRAALISGAIDIYPEYTGNAAFFFHADADPVWKDAAAGYARAKALDFAANRLVWLKPAPADNSWAIALRKDIAETHHLASLADFATWIDAGGQVKLAASAEFVESLSGLPSFESAYGFRLDARQLLVLSGGDTTATMKAAADNISGVNAAMAYGTDGAVAVLDLVILADPKHAEPVYAPAPVVRAEVLAEHPSIEPILDRAFGTLDVATLRGLNEKIAVEGENAKDVARAYLVAKGLLR